MTTAPIVAKSIMRQNAEKDPAYCPYCLRCSGLVRMVKVETFLWKCKCGAVHDERDDVPCPSCKGSTTNPPGTAPCSCCKGVGTITKARDEILARIRGDLTRRLIERGIVW